MFFTPEFISGVIFYAVTMLNLSILNKLDKASGFINARHSL